MSSWELARELADAARRPKLDRYRISERDLEDLLVLLSPTLPAVDVDVPLRDEDDAPVVAAAVAGRADAIVTGDADLLEDGELRAWLAERRVALLRPAELLASL